MDETVPLEERSKVLSPLGSKIKNAITYDTAATRWQEAVKPCLFA